MALKTLLFSERKFDKVLAFDLYKMYLDTLDRGVLNELLYQIGSLVNYVFISRINNPRISPPDKDLLRTEAIDNIFIKLQEQVVPLVNPVKFTNYLCVIAEHAMLQVFRNQIGWEKFDLWQRCADPPNSIVHGPSVAEKKMYYSQLMQMILSTFIADIRFEGKEKDACVFIAESLLGIHRFSPMTARFRFKLRNEQQTTALYRYTVISLRTIAFAMKEFDASIALME